jgi:hypothetical protein
MEAFLLNATPIVIAIVALLMIAGELRQIRRILERGGVPLDA